MGTSSEQNKNTKTGRARQIAAIIGIVLLAGMYVVTFISACIGSDASGRLFRLSLGMTIAIPIFLWIFIWCIGVLTHKGSMASMDILDSNPEERAKMEEAIHKMQEQEDVKKGT